MSLTTIVLIAGAFWSILSISVGSPIGRAMKRADRRPQLDPVFRIVSMYPPPLAPRESDADWLSPWPTDAGEFDPFWWLNDDDAVSTVIDEMEGDFR